MESSYCNCCCRRRRAVAAINAKLLWTLTICGASVSILLFFFVVVGSNDELLLFINAINAFCAPSSRPQRPLTMPTTTATMAIIGTSSRGVSSS